jgi:hypothetical protein
MSKLAKHSSLVGTLVMGGLLMLSAGCGGPYDSSVYGIATLNSAPLPGGTVKFTPEQAGPSGYALIDGDGSYSVMTGREEGLPSGAYVVTVVTNQPSIPNKNPSLPPTPGKPITPAWYRDPTQSPLKYTVEPGKNEINLELSSQPPPGWNPRGRRSG